MAMSSAVIWEVRPTNGSDSNGGGFTEGASGTDYSQQNAAQYALTGVTSSGAGATILTASAAADMVGNIIQVISGTNFNVGFYEITSVSVGVSITCSTNSAGSNIASGVGASGVMNIGGALKTLQPITSNTVNSRANGVDGNIIYIKAEATITLTASYDVRLIKHKVIGYTTTRTDNGRVTITTATNSVILQNYTQGSYMTGYQNIAFTNTAGTRAEAIKCTNNANYHYYLTFDNCTFDGFTFAINGGFPAVFAATQHHFLMINCEVKNCTTHGMRLYDPIAAVFIGCFIHDNTGDGIHIEGGGNAGSVTLIDTVCYNNTVNGIYNNRDGSPNQTIDMRLYNCAMVSNGASGCKINPTFTSNSHMLTIVNTIFYGNTAYGIEVPTTSHLSLWYHGRNNAFGSNTSGARSGFPTLTGDISLSADPFTNKAAADFSLNATAGGGAACKAAGYEPILF